MKNKLSLLVLAFSMLLSSSIIAQSSKAIMSLATLKKAVDDAHIAANFKLDNIADNATKGSYDNKFKASQLVTEVLSNLNADGTASYTVTFRKDGGIEVLTAMLQGAGVTKVQIDADLIDIDKLPEYVRSHNKTAKAGF